MSDLMKKENRGKLALGVGGVLGGIGVFAMAGIIHALPFYPFSTIAAGILVLWGGWRLFQKPNSVLTGLVGMAAGLLVAVSPLPLVGGLAKILLDVSGVGLIAAGIWTIYKVFRDRRS